MYVSITTYHTSVNKCVIGNIRQKVLLWGNNNTNIFCINKSSAEVRTHDFWSYLAGFKRRYDILLPPVFFPKFLIQATVLTVCLQTNYIFCVTRINQSFWQLYCAPASAQRKNIWVFALSRLTEPEAKGLVYHPLDGSIAQCRVTPSRNGEATGWITWFRKTACFSLCILILFTVDIDIDQWMPSEDDQREKYVICHSAVDD